MSFNGWRRESRKMGFVGKDHVVSDDGETRIGNIEPRWDLTIGDNVDVPNPWCIFFDGSEGISEFFIICAKKKKMNI